MKGFLSRKFLVTALLVLGAVGIALGGDADQLQGMAEKLGALLAAAAVVWKYVHTEGEIDKAALPSGTQQAADLIVKEVQDETSTE